MKELEKALVQTFEDYRLSKNEKYALRELLEDYKQDSAVLSFVRNTAFDLVNIHCQRQNHFDVQAFKWLEQIVKTIDSVRNKPDYSIRSEAFFSPGNECKQRIISLIKNAKSTLDVCVFTISDNDISDAILAAHNKDIAVRIVTDNDKSNDAGSDVDYLAGKGVPVVKDQTDKHMHHKFAIIDKRYLINGSFNWTRSASQYNEENITVLSEPHLVDQFMAEFEKLWKRFNHLGAYL